MSASKDQLHSQADTLRRKIAVAEATLQTLRDKLAKTEAKITGAPTPLTGLDHLWKAALPKSRERSAKQLCRVEWNRIPSGERPTIPEAITALKAWNRCEQWRKDSHDYVPGLHRWIKARMWEDLPEDGTPDPGARYRPPQKPQPASTGEGITDRAEIAKLLSLRVNS
jgi:hypothetical protein